MPMYDLNPRVHVITGHSIDEIECDYLKPVLRVLSHVDFKGHVIAALETNEFYLLKQFEFGLPHIWVKLDYLHVSNLLMGLPLGEIKG